jgi:hypothetical protein
MSPSDSLRRLAQGFEQARPSWPELWHTLIEGDESVVWENIDDFLKRNRFLGGSFGFEHFKKNGEFYLHVFHALSDDGDRKGKTFSKLRELAGAAVKLLVEVGKLPAAEECEPGHPLAIDDHGVCRLMVFIHRLAQEHRPGSDLRADRRTDVYGRRLPAGMSASFLPVGVFEGAALALEAVAYDISIEHINKEHGANKPQLTKAEEINELRRYILECSHAGKEPTTRGAGDRIGRSAGYASKLPPMRTYLDEQKKRKSGTMGRATSLTDQMEQGAAAKGNWPDGGPGFDVVEREFLERANPDEKSYYSNLNEFKDKKNFIYMSPEDRLELVEAVKDQRADDKKRKVQPSSAPRGRGSKGRRRPHHS